MRSSVLTVIFFSIFSCAYPFANGRKLQTDAVDLFRAGMYGEIIRLSRDNEVEDGPTKLLLALSYDKLGLPQQSNGELKELFLQRNFLRPYAAYLLGLRFEELGDAQNAVRWYKNAFNASGSPDSKFPLSADGRAVALASLHRLGNIGIRDGSCYDTVMKTLTKASADYPIALYHLGLLFLNRGDKERAVETLVGVLQSGSDEKVEKKIIETLTGDFRLIEKADSKGLSKHEIVQICIKTGLFRNALFVTYLLPYGADVARLRALCFSRMGDYASSALLYNEYYMQFKDPDGLLQAAIAYNQMGDKEHARAFLTKYVRESEPGGRSNADALFLQLKLERERVPPETFVRSSESFVNGNRSYPGLDRVIQETFYFTLQNKLSDQALEYLKGAYDSIKDPLFRAWGSYLLGLYLDNRYYLDALSLFPGSYYYHMAARELVLEADLVKEADELYDLGNFDDALELYIRLYSKGSDETRVRDRIGRILGRSPAVSRLYDLGRLQTGEISSVLFTLLKMGLSEELEDLVEEALAVEGEKEDFYYFYLLSRVAYEQGKPFSGVRNAEDMLRSTDPRYAVFLPPEILKLLYPNVFRELIYDRTRAAASKFDDLFILSIIREESRYNDRAQSLRGAMGLMQILPSTARWIRGGRFERADLFDPGYNIQTGVLYLKFLSERFGSDAAVLAAYNGGPANAKKWLSSSEHSDERKFIEEIPFQETRNYVKKVLTSYAMYRSLYEDL
jgi:soluble lytic murein transglycosylase